MNPRWAGFTAPFRWLLDAVDVGRHQPVVVVGAVAATALVGFLPSLPPVLLALAGITPGAAAQSLFQMLSVAIAVLVTPVLKAGVYRILDGAEAGRPVAVGQVFDGFRDGGWVRPVVCALLGLALFFALLVAMMLTMAIVAGGEALLALQQWFEQVQALQAKAEASGQPMKPDAMPKPPDGLGGVLVVLLAFLPLWSVVALGNAWALVSVALRGATPLAAIVGGLRAAFLNAAPLLAMLAVLALPALLLSMLLALLMVAFVAVASLLGPAVASLATLLVVLLASIVVAAISYAFVLNGWRAACDEGGGGGGAAADNPPLAGFEA